MKKRYGFAAAAISAAFALSVTACGGDSSSSSEGTTKVSKVDDLSTECEDGDEALVGEEEEVLYTCTDGKWASEEAKSSASKPKSSSSKVEDSDEEECDEELEVCDDDDTSSSSIAKSSASKGDSGDKGGSGSGEEGGSSDSGSGSGEEGGSSDSGSGEGSSSDSGSGEGSSSDSGSGEEGGSSDSGSEEGSSSDSGSGEENNPYAFSGYESSLSFGATTSLKNLGLQNGGNCKYTLTEGSLDNVTIVDMETNEEVPATDFENYSFGYCQFSVQNKNISGSDQTIGFTVSNCSAYDCDDLTDAIREANKVSLTLASGTKPTLSATSTSLEYNGTSKVSLAGYENCSYKFTIVRDKGAGILPGTAGAYSVTGATKNSDGNYESPDCNITIKDINNLSEDFGVKVTLVQAMHSTNTVTITPSGVAKTITIKHKEATITPPAVFSFLNDYVTWTSEKETEQGMVYTGTYVGLGNSIIENEGYTCTALGQSKTEVGCVKKLSSSTSYAIALDTILHTVSAGVIRQ